MGDTFQFTCPQCKNVMWVTAGATTNCNRCNAPLATQIAQAEMGTGMPQVPSAVPGLDALTNAAANRLIASRPKSARTVVLLVFAGIVVIVGAGIAWTMFKNKLGLSTAKGNLAYSALGIDMKHGDPDKMIAVLQGPARQWAGDAALWSINLGAVGADGTMDLSNGGATITYVSPSRVQDYAPSRRKDALKDFAFGPGGVGYDRVTGARDRWKDVPLPRLGGCSIKKLVSVLNASYGLTAGKTVHISFDPRFRMVIGPVDGWHVTSTDPAITMNFSMEDCSEVKPH